MKKRILWIVDVVGWAYDNRAVTLAAKLPDYEHSKAVNIPLRSKAVRRRLWQNDLFVCPDPRVLPFIPVKSLTVLNLNATKIFTTR